MYVLLCLLLLEMNFVQYQEKYTCLCDSVQMIVALLGSEGLLSITIEILICAFVQKCTGSEKLIAALESAAPEKLLASAFY